VKPGGLNDDTPHLRPEFPVVIEIVAANA